MIIAPFVIGFIYFAVKAYRLKENIFLYGIIGGIGTWICSVLIGFLFLSTVAITDEILVLITVSATISLAIYLVDRWSGLSWNVAQYAAQKEKKNDKLSSDALAAIRSLQIQKDEGLLEELQAYESALSVRNSEVEKLELTQNSLPGEVAYIVIPDTIKNTLPKDEEGLIKCITEFKKYTEEEWTESIPMYAAIELDKTGFAYSPEIEKQLDEYAKSLNLNNFIELVSAYIPK